MIVSGVGCWKW